MDLDRRRWAVFTKSVVSEHGNPGAHFYRALGRCFSELNQDATFFEQRANPAIHQMLTEQGAGALERFRSQHPEIDYRTVTPVTGHKLVESLLRDLSTIDIALVDRNAPHEFVDWIGQLTRYYLTTFLIDPGEPDTSPAPISDETLESYSGLVVVRNDQTDLAARVSSDRLYVVDPGDESDEEQRREQAAISLITICARATDLARLRYLQQPN